MNTSLLGGDLRSQLTASRAKTEALASAQEKAEGRARSLFKAEQEPSADDDRTISWSTVLEQDGERHEVDHATMGRTEMTQDDSLDLERGGTILSHSGLVVLESSSDMWERRRRGMRTWRSGDAIELLEGLWRGFMGCFHGFFSVLGVRMGPGEESTPLVGVQANSCV